MSFPVYLKFNVSKLGAFKIVSVETRQEISFCKTRSLNLIHNNFHTVTFIELVIQQQTVAIY